MQLSSSSVSSTVAAGASGGGSSSTTEIERLQRQFKNLQKSIADLPNQGLPPNQVRERAQLLTQQIVIVQAQIARLKTQNNVEQAETQVENRHSASIGTANTDAAAKARTTDKVTGASASSDARSQANKATQAQPAHPASAEAITPAEPPLVSVKA